LTLTVAQMYIDNETVCVLEGTIGGFCSVSSALLTGCLARDSYRVAVSKARDRREAGCGWFDWCCDVGLGLLVPIGCVVTISLTEGYGNHHDMPVLCHLYQATLQAEIAGFYGWIWLSLLAGLYYNIRIVLLLREMSRDSLPQQVQLNLKFMLLYPVIYAICCLPSFVYRIMRFVSLDPSQVLYGVGQTTFALIGFFDAFVLGCSNRRVRRQLCARFRSKQVEPLVFLVSTGDDLHFGSVSVNGSDSELDQPSSFT